MILCLLLAISIPLADCVVHFAHSDLFDGEDVRGEAEVPLPLCAGGCFIFSSSSQSDDDDYHKNIFIARREDEGPAWVKVMSLRDLSLLYYSNETLQREALTLQKGSYAILNRNFMRVSGPLAIYVYYRSTFDFGWTPLPVYDIGPTLDLELVRTGKGGSFSILSVFPFTLVKFCPEASAPGDHLVSKSTVFTAGFDASSSDCRPLLHFQCTHCNDDEYEGNKFRFAFRSPLATVVFDGGDVPVIFTFTVVRGVDSIMPFEKDAQLFVMSPGFIGCTSGEIYNVDPSIVSSNEVYTQLSATERLKTTVSLPVNELGSNGSIAILVHDEYNGIDYDESVRFNSSFSPVTVVSGRSFTVQWTKEGGDAQWALTFGSTIPAPPPPTSSPPRTWTPSSPQPGPVTSSPPGPIFSSPSSPLSSSPSAPSSDSPTPPTTTSGSRDVALSILLILAAAMAF